MTNIEVNLLLAVVCQPFIFDYVIKCGTLTWISLEHRLQKVSRTFIFDQVEIDRSVQDQVLKGQWTPCIVEWCLTREQVVKRDAEGPDVRALRMDHVIVVRALPLEYLRCEEQVRPQLPLQEFLVCLLWYGTEAKVNEDCLVIVVDHNILRLDVTMDQSNHFVTVVEGLAHVDEVFSHLCRV